jgi:hypothetical protein
LRREIASLTKMINIATAMRIWDFFGMDLTSVFEVSESISSLEIIIYKKRHLRWKDQQLT